jgi:hypothetical protein
MRQAVGRFIHVEQRRWVGQQRAQRRGEEVRRRVRADAAGGQQAADDLGQAQAFGDAKADAVLAVAPKPAAAGEAGRDA